MSKFTVEDTFNKKTVSTHRTLLAAVKGERKFLRAVKRSNGANSYLPMQIRENGVRVVDEVLTEARIQADKDQF